MSALKQRRVAATTIGLVAVDLVRKTLSGESLSTSQLFFFVLGYLFLSIYLAWIQGEMRLCFAGLASVLWLNFFVVGSFSNMIEGYFFTSVFESDTVFIMGALAMLFFSGIQAGLASIILEKGGNGLMGNLVEYFADAKTSGLIKRITVGTLTYFPVYFFFGMLVSPFVMPYYRDSSLGLIIPPFTVIVPLEVFRGFMYVICLIPITAALASGRRNTAIAFIGMLFIPGALLPLLADQGLPAPIIPFHLVEIFADSVVYGYILARLLEVKKGITI